MNREQVLSLVAEKLADGTVSASDLASLAPVAASSTKPAHEEGHSVVSKVLYSLGALVAVVGALILVADNWEALGVGGRFLVTLGLAIFAFAFAGVSAERGSRSLASAAYVIALVLTPIGVAVFFHDWNVDVTLRAQAFAAALAAVLFGGAAWRYRLPVPALGAAVAASWAYFALAVDLSEKFLEPEPVIRAALLAAAAAYGVLGWQPRQGAGSEGSQANAVRGLLCLGAVGCFVASLGSLEPDWRGLGALAVGLALWYASAARATLAQMFSVAAIFALTFDYEGAWLVAPAALAFGAMYAAVASRRTPVLFLASGTVVAVIVRVTGEFFVNVFGWAVSLMAFGFLLIGAGFATVRLKRKYIEGEAR